MTDKEKIKWYKSAWRDAVKTMVSTKPDRDLLMIKLKIGFYLQNFDEATIKRAIKEKSR